jgi:hypothetical protein
MSAAVIKVSGVLRPEDTWIFISTFVRLFLIRLL